MKPDSLNEKKQNLKNNILSFAKTHYGNIESAESIIAYIHAKLGNSIYQDGKWTVDDEKIEYRYEWGAHSFFDDGGGEDFLILWFMKTTNGMKHPENDRLLNLQKYPEYDGSDESFVCMDPFGLSGLFEFHYRSFREKTD